jgi:hypothetical protein
MSEARTAADTADIDVQARRRARTYPPAADHRIADDHGKRVARADGPACPAAMPTSMPIAVSQKDLSVSTAWWSEALDNSPGLQVWSRTCYTHVK